jgi:hypothetical protein
MEMELQMESAGQVVIANKAIATLVITGWQALTPWTIYMGNA